VNPDNHVAHNSLGYVLLNERREDQSAEAIKEFQAAIDANPRYVDAFCNLAVALLRQRRLDDAETAARRACELDPLDARACHNLGNVLYVQGRLADAAEVLRQAADLAPGSALVHNDLGKVLLDAGRLDEAIDELRTAIACQTFLPMAWRNLANALAQRGREGDYDEAVNAAQLAVAFEPANSNNQKILDRATALASHGRAVRPLGSPPVR
jgi:Flp pilus assembly protein TadD